MVYITSTSTSHVSRNDNDESRRVSTDANANQVINQQTDQDIIQLHLSYEDSQDVEIYQLPKFERQLKFDEQSASIDALEPIDRDIAEIEPNKFTIVRDRENGNEDERIKLMKLGHKVDYGDLDTSASLDSDVKVCNEILNSINFDEISLTSLRKLRHSHLKLQKMSNINSLDSDTKVFNEIWNAVKDDKFGTVTRDGLTLRHWTKTQLLSVRKLVESTV